MITNTKQTFDRYYQKKNAPVNLFCTGCERIVQTPFSEPFWTKKFVKNWFSIVKSDKLNFAKWSQSPGKKKE
jgi:hypothetical protein